MRYIRKKLTCANRFDEQKNIEAMKKIEKRYLEKMAKNGWRLDENDPAAEGNAFFKWERYITLKKD